MFAYMQNIEHEHMHVFTNLQINTQPRIDMYGCKQGARWTNTNGHPLHPHMRTPESMHARPITICMYMSIHNYMHLHTYIHVHMDA